MEVKNDDTRINDPSDKLFGYSNFNDVTDPVLRSWNRLNTLYNIRERFRGDVYQTYRDQFEKDDLISILKMGLRVEVEGYENVRREMMKEYNA
jgi:hypothetical protein